MAAEPPVARSRKLIAFVPVLLFLGLATVFALQLMNPKDGSELPSALIGKPAPRTDLLPLVPNLPGLKSTDFAGRVSVLNVFASWCVPCREEAPALIEIAKDQRFTLVGLNYKDKPENAANFLTEFGNPFAAIGTDISGRAGIEWGVYGVPETYVIGKDGTIRFKFVGPLDEKSWKASVLPQVEKALAG